jgi:hypothetical protein
MIDFSKYISPMSGSSGWASVSDAVDVLIAQKNLKEKMELEKAKMAEEKRRMDIAEARQRTADELAQSQMQTQADTGRRLANVAESEALLKYGSLAANPETAAFAPLHLAPLGITPGMAPAPAPSGPAPLGGALGDLVGGLHGGQAPAPETMSQEPSMGMPSPQPPPNMPLPLLAKGENSDMGPVTVKAPAEDREVIDQYAGYLGLTPQDETPEPEPQQMLYKDGKPFAPAVLPKTYEKEADAVRTGFEALAMASPKSDPAKVKGISMNAENYLVASKGADGKVNAQKAIAMMMTEYDKAMGLQSKYDLKKGAGGKGKGSSLGANSEYGEITKKLDLSERKALDGAVKEVWTAIGQVDMPKDAVRQFNVADLATSAFKSGKPGAQKMGLWLLSRALNGGRLTDKDISQFYQFGDEWAYLKTKMNQWGAMSAQDASDAWDNAVQSGAIDSGTLQALIDGAAKMKQHAEGQLSIVRDKAYDLASTSAVVTGSPYANEKFIKTIADRATRIYLSRAESAGETDATTTTQAGSPAASPVPANQGLLDLGFKPVAK